MGRSLAFLLAVFAALLSQQGNSAVLLFDGEAGQNELAADRAVPAFDKCGQQVTSLCKEKMTLRQDLLFGGVVNKLNCVVENQKALDDVCFYTEVEQTLDSIVNNQGSKCHDELRAKCGKQIDDLKKAIQRTSIIGTVKGAVDVVECIISHAEDLWDKCKPGKKMEDTIEAIVEESAVEPAAEVDCATRAEELCPPTSHKILGLGYSLGCLSSKAKELGNDCLIEQMSMAVEEMEAFADRPCHDELRKKCGKQIDQLKKDIKDTSILGILKSSVDVVQCIAQNAEDLWKKCNPFQEVAENAQAEIDLEPPYIAGSPTPPTRKPTRRPTHRPTKKPTPKPTTLKPTKSQPTGKPTPRAIAEAVVYDDFLKLEEVHSMDTPKMHEEPAHMLRDMDDDKDFMDDDDMDMTEPAEQMDVKVTSIQVDMDACVRSARQHCSAEVAAFNESPFDRTRFQRLNDCIDAKSSLIETDCVTKSQSSGSWTSWFSSGRGYRRGYHGTGYDHHGHHGHHDHDHPHHHRHHDHSFDTNGYNAEEGFWGWSREFGCPHHGHHHRKHAIAGMAGFVVFFVAFFVGRRACLRRRQAAVEAAQQRPAINGGLYQPLKSDDAPAVPVTNIV